MSVVTHGPEHQWRAWRPVDTTDQGWTWLRRIYRRRVYLDLPGAPGPFWTYSRQPQEAKSAEVATQAVGAPSIYDLSGAQVERSEPHPIGFTADTGRLEEIPDGWS